MKIQLLSDLHLEVQAAWQPSAVPQADVLVLAGDIGSYQIGSQLIDTDFGLRRFSPKHGWTTPVIFVPGNHEYDGLDFDATHARLRDTCQRLGIIWLEREVVHWPLNGTGETGPVRFIGTTLWTDFDALGPGHDDIRSCDGSPSGRHGLLAQQLKARGKACRAADYYLQKTGTTRQGVPMLSEAVREQALVCQRWLCAALSKPFGGKTVVITHFAPSLHSADPRYGLTPGSAGFCNALDHLLPSAHLWLHGHLHAPSNYVHRGCHVVANPMGYARKNEQANFDPRLLVHV